MPTRVSTISYQEAAKKGNISDVLRQAALFASLWALGSSWAVAIRECIISLNIAGGNRVLSELTAASITTLFALGVTALAGVLSMHSQKTQVQPKDKFSQPCMNKEPMEERKSRMCNCYILFISLIIILVPSLLMLTRRGSSGSSVVVYCKNQRPTLFFTSNKTPPNASILIVGQSNANGLFNTCPLAYVSMNRYLYRNQRWNVLGIGGSGFPFGPEIGVSQILNESMAKVARNGASIHEFLPGTETFAQLLRIPIEPSCALFWVQGESDSMNYTNASHYEENFKIFVDGIKTLSGCKTMKIISALVRPSELMPYAHVVNEALQNVSDATVNTTTLTLSDNVHYDGESQIRLGREMALSYLNL